MYIMLNLHVLSIVTLMKASEGVLLNGRCSDQSCSIFCGYRERLKFDLEVYRAMYDNYLGKPFHRPRRRTNTSVVEKLFRNMPCGTRAADSDKANAYGEDAADKPWPWHASVYNGNNYCGGVLISNEWVLTQVACAVKDSAVVLGLHDSSNTTTTRQVKRISLVEIHEDYNDKSHNIALLRLDSPVTLNDHVRPLCLPLDEIALDGSEKCFVTGFTADGKTSGPVTGKLRQLRVNIMPQTMCIYIWNSIGLSFDRRTLCLDLAKGDPCLGGVGVPLSCQVDDKFYLVGLFNLRLSDGVCNRHHFPDAFIRVSEFVSWILETIRDKSHIL